MDEEKVWPKEAYLIEHHPNLLCDELKELWEKIETDIIVYNRLPFKLFETLRNPVRQEMLVATGKSKTLQSRHLPNAVGKSEAMDIVVYIDGKYSWANEHIHYYQFLADKIKEKFGDKIESGAHWTHFRDWPHHQLIKKS